MKKNRSKVHIVYCHPSEKSMTFNIKEAYIKGLKDNDIQYSITDLYKSNFTTDISENEYLRENNSYDYDICDDVLAEQEKINNSNVLTFIFPLFWMDAPSKLVGYFTRVFTKGFKYDYDDGTKSSMKILDKTNFLISSGSNYNDLKRIIK